MRTGLAAGLALLLTGCATLNTVPAPVVLPDSPALLKAWAMDGRIGVQSAGTAWQANLYWEHDDRQDRLRISGPLSQGLISIIVQKDLIYVNEGNGVTQLSRNPDALLRQRLGFVAPLTSLRYWMLGVPDPGKAALRIKGEEHDTGGFEQAGWRIYPGELANVDGWMLPRKLRAQGAGVKLKILADNWQLRD